MVQEEKKTEEKQTDSIESLVLKAKKDVEDAAFKYAELQEKQLQAKKKIVKEKDFNKLKFVSDGQDGYKSSEVFSRCAIYDVLNLKTGVKTVFNGLQFEAMFGLDNETRTQYATKQVEMPIYRTQRYVAKFRHFERK